MFLLLFCHFANRAKKQKNNNRVLRYRNIQKYILKYTLPFKKSQKDLKREKEIILLTGKN